MSRDALATLFHPFERGMLPLPESGARLLFLDAEAGVRPPDGFDAALFAVQPFRPSFLALERTGHAVVPEVPAGERWDQALIVLQRHRGQGERRLAEALRRVPPGGLIVAGGANKDGAASFARRAGELLPVDGRASKHHGTVFWLRRPDDVATAVAVLEAGSAPVLLEEGFETAPGMFSHGRVDPGSALLAAHLPGDLSGDVADFAAGWGYLSVAAVRASPGIRSLALYEADHDALAAARRNLARLLPGTEASFHWHDLTAEEVEPRHDAAVMNPPFHESRAADPELGAAIIRRAATALRAGGRLFLVANRHLPYEEVLAKVFSRSGEAARDGAFKVLWARR